MEKQSFWDRYARRYSHFVRADQEAYAQMLEWIRPAVRDRTVLELATGTGVIAHGIVHEAASIEATDASAGMIDVARSHSHSRDDDEIAVAGISQSLEQIRTDDIRNSS